MVQFVPVSPERHRTKKWRRIVDYRFASADPVTPIVGAELAKAALSMPLAFIKAAGRYTLVGLLSLTPGRNMFVDSNGRWLGSYLPAAFRTYPFALAGQNGAGRVVMCVDEDSGLVVEAGTSGEDFFEPDSSLSPALKPVLELLSEVQRNRQTTDAQIANLARAGVIRPWQIKINSGEGEKSLSGLHHIDETALAALPDEDFVKLRAVLPIAYAQMISEYQLGMLAQLAKLKQQPRERARLELPESLDVLFELPTDDIVKFK